MKRFNTLECFAMVWPQHINFSGTLYTIVVHYCLLWKLLCVCVDIASSSCFSVLIQDDDDGRRVYGAGGRVGARRITRPSLGKTTAKGKEKSLLLFIYCILHILLESRDFRLKPFFSYLLDTKPRMYGKSHEIQSRNRLTLKSKRWLIISELQIPFRTLMIMKALLQYLKQISLFLWNVMMTLCHLQSCGHW